MRGCNGKLVASGRFSEDGLECADCRKHFSTGTKQIGDRCGGAKPRSQKEAAMRDLGMVKVRGGYE